MITAQVETFAGAIAEAEPLLREHWEELALYKDRMPLAPDYASYFRAEAEGRLLVVTVRADGELVGYFAGFLGASPHYKHTSMCKMDILYIRPDQRGKRGGVLLLKEIQRELKARGVQVWWMGSKDHKSIDRLYEYFGFERAETYFSMWLGDEP